ncbi:Uncharacterised protein [Mycobacteroides abscessus subsp. abscessus]|nr:Uncharacterised protein [Mycobacteroides abscessus subsp. abscessus]
MYVQHPREVLAQLLGSPFTGTGHGADVEYGAGKQVWSDLRQIPSRGISPVGGALSPDTHG